MIIIIIITRVSNKTNTYTDYVHTHTMHRGAWNAWVDRYTELKKYYRYFFYKRKKNLRVESCLQINKVD